MMKYADVILKEITTQAAEYLANDAIGGLWSLDGCYSDLSAVTILNSVLVRKKSSVATQMSLFIFDEEPTASTFTENGPLDIHDNDVNKVVGVVTIDNHSTFGAGSLSYLNNIGQMIKGKRTANRTLWFALRMDETTTFGSTSDMSLLLGFLKE